MKNVVYKYLNSLDIAGLATYDDSPAILMTRHQMIRIEDGKEISMDGSYMD